MANVPTFVDGGDKPSRKEIYYHSGLDIGGAEGMVDVVAATEGLVVSARGDVLEGYKKGTPVDPRYDVVYVLDNRGWYYRYSHLKEIDAQILPGRRIKIGSPIGVLVARKGGVAAGHICTLRSSRANPLASGEHSKAMRFFGKHTTRNTIPKSSPSHGLITLFSRENPFDMARRNRGVPRVRSIAASGNCTTEPHRQARTLSEPTKMRAVTARYCKSPIQRVKSITIFLSYR